VVGRGAPSIGSPSPSYRAFLATEWLPALDGVVDTLAAGGRVADVGCGHGASIVAMAQAFPYATFTEARP
jgi:tRNA G46 methylase TrmB